MAANVSGGVATGFSDIHVALYSAEDGGTVKYTSVRKLGRSVSMSTDISTSDDNNFYADDVLAETETGSAFTDGSGSIAVDGLSSDEEAFIMGLATGNSYEVSSSTSVETYEYGESMNPPFLGLGAVKMVQRNGKSSWKAIILTKIRFKVPGDDLTAKGNRIDWQTQSLDFTIMRDDSSMARWKIIPKTEFTTRADAIAFVKKVLGGEV